MAEALKGLEAMQGDYPPAHVQTGIEVVYADDSLIVLNKPAGLLAVPGRGEDKQDCLSRRAQQHYPDALIVHRLDMATSGLMLMARGAAMQRALAKLFEDRKVCKRYVAVVDGDIGKKGKLRPAKEEPEAWQLIDLPINVDWSRRPLRVIDPIHGKASQTRWRITSFDAAAISARVELEPITGRSHQLRVHMQALGHPILGDMLYAPQAVQAKASRLLLHATTLAFDHPESGQPLRFQVAPDF